MRGLFVQSLQQQGVEIDVLGAIPSVHAFNHHKCKNSFGARAAGLANADEQFEQNFAWLTHRFVHMKNMARTTAVLFLELRSAGGLQHPQER